MGSVQQLRRMGVGAIPLAEGVTRFVRHCTHDAGERQIIIVARLAGLATWPVSERPSLSLRFIDGIVAHQPGVELVSRTRLEPQRDAYLRDHSFKGSMLFPAVFGLEAMAQAAAAAVGPSVRIQGLLNVRLSQAIIVPPEGLLVEVRACVRETVLDGDEALVDCSIGTESSGFAGDSFAATVRVRAVATCSQACSLQPQSEQPAEANQQLGTDAGTVPPSGLYGGLLFQGPSFQGIGGVTELTHTSVQLTAEDVSNGLDGEQWLTGNPHQRDVALQALLLMKCHQEQLPVAIQEISFGPGSFEPGSRSVHAVDLGREGADNVSNITIANTAGDVVERIRGLHGRVMSERGWCFPFAEDLSEPGRQDETHMVDTAV